MQHIDIDELKQGRKVLFFKVTSLQLTILKQNLNKTQT